MATLVEAINSGNPFKLNEYMVWIRYIDDPYPWLVYDECSTMLKQNRIKEILIDEDGFWSNDWIVEEKKEKYKDKTPDDTVKYYCEKEVNNVNELNNCSKNVNKRKYILKECKVCDRSFLAANEFKMFCISCREYLPDYLKT